MIARIVTLMLIAVLALPIATLTPPGAPGQPAGSDIAVEAKGKKHKKSKKPKAKPGTRTERQTVTRTFASTVPITIPDESKANPYPSAIEVGGLPNGTITDVNLILNDFTHGAPEDVSVLLSTSDGRQALVMSDAGSTPDVTDIDLTLDDEAGADLPDASALSGGTFRPANYVGFMETGDPFASPAPNPNGNVALSAFDGADPNGTWQLWLMDDVEFDDGDLGGWALQITAETDVQVEEPAQAKTKKHKKGKKRR